MSKPRDFTDSSDPELIKLLQNGAVGVLATDTVYGLVCSARDQSAVERLYRLKSREGKPGTVIAANVEQLVELGIKARYLKAVEHYWPNPISIVVPVSEELGYLHQGLPGLAVRIPKQPFLELNGPLLTSSANQPGEPPASTIEEAKAYFGDSVDFYVDGGDLSGRLPSTLIRIVDDAVELLRPGAVTIDEESGEIV